MSKGIRFFLLCAAATFVTGSRSPEVFGSDNPVFWSASESPEHIGRLVTEDLLSRPDFMMYRSGTVNAVHYAEACAGFGAVRLAAHIGDSASVARLSARYRRVIDEAIVNTADHVDANVYGILPLELALRTGSASFRTQGLALADGQWAHPLPDGMTEQTRYWIDDIWMIGSLQVQAFRVTGNPLYLDRAALEIDAYLRKLQQPNGLFHHGENAPFFWGRGNGWVAAGLAELLSELPETHPRRAFLLDGYIRMMNALLRFQAEDGMWRQLIDHGESWKETSSSAMFGYAISVGLNEGLLKDPAFESARRKAWHSLVNYIGTDGKITDVCVGTGKGDSVPYYLGRPRTTGDMHGQAPVLWFAWSLLSR
ncbi:glycoside hydrolase family 88 protein [bacterium]|nr:glycoside hydrolase family 88 protein [bacterium]